MKRLLSCLSDYKVQTVLAPLFKCLEAIFELFVPMIISSMIDVGIGNKDLTYIMRMGLVLLALALIGLLCSFTAQYFSALVAAHTGKRFRSELFQHINTLGYAEIDQLGTASLITRMTSDINQVENAVNMLLRLFMRSPFIVFGSVIMAFRISVKGSLIFLLTVPLLMLVVFGIMLLTMPMYKNVQNRLDRVMKIARENLLGVRVVRAFNRQEREQKDFKEENDLLTYLQVKVGRVSALLNPLTYVIINLSIVALIYNGARLVNTGDLTQGNVVALVNYMSQILVELIKLANFIILLTRGFASLGRLDNVFAVKSSVRNIDKTEESSRTVEKPYLSFQDVSFSYGSAQENALDDISFTVDKGQTIGVIGGTGSGKTSLMNLISRFYDINAGEIYLKGCKLKDYKLEELRMMVGLVPQRSVLFTGTLRENMLWGRDEATDEEIWEALKIAQAYDFVMEKAEGLEFRIEQEGRNLSGGQKQRLCIARALVRKAEILILDDSASALDFATDARLRRDIKAHTGDSTVFLVSQRVSTVRNADKIIVLDDGRIAGIGTHAALYKTCEVYQEICNSQLSEADREREA